MKRILTIYAIIMVAANIKALPEWPRKYATTIIRGHVTHFPKTTDYTVTVYKGEKMPYEYFIDKAGVFSIKWNMCWPTSHRFKICGIDLNMLHCPGDTIDIEIDYRKAQELKDDTERLYQEAIKIRGTFIHFSPQYMALGKKLQNDAHYINTDELKKHCRADFNAYREREWRKHLKRMKEVKASRLKKNEKELLQLMMEENYISNLYSFDLFMRFIGCDSAEMASVKQQFTVTDPHARSLAFPKSINGAYCFKTGHLEYLKANGLDNLPLGRYLKERKRAEDIEAQLKAFRTVSSNDINNLSPEFRQPLHELKAEMADKVQPDADWRPTGEPATWLQQIVARHSRRIVYIDYWATWCGPCQKGINEMATVKDKYEKLGVDFVYITDNSSSTDGFLNLKQKHTGDHFLFTKDEISQMNIPGFSNSIPHYLIYGRNGRFVKAINGWCGLENMTKELDKALAE